MDGWIFICLFIHLAKKKRIPTFGTRKKSRFFHINLEIASLYMITCSTSAQNVWGMDGPQLDRFEAPFTTRMKLSGHLSEIKSSKSPQVLASSVGGLRVDL